MSEASVPWLHRLSRIDYFSKVGTIHHVTVAPCKAVPVRSWEEACGLRGSVRTADAFQEAKGRLTTKLGAEFRKDYRRWNTIVAENRTLLAQEVWPKVVARLEKIEDFPLIECGKEFVEDAVLWDLVHYTMEQSYAHLVTPGFYSLLLQVYEAGRFPCDWDEVWPNGTLWIL